MPDGRDGVVHGSAVALDGRGLLILGPSGAGKSTLTLNLLALGAALVSDDATLICGTDPLEIRAPAAIAGRVEARGLGLLPLPAVPSAPLWMVVALRNSPGPRLPHPQRLSVKGRDVPLFTCADAPNLAASLILCLRHATLPTDTHP